jgi:para-nitrobenzyl esterase
MSMPLARGLFHRAIAQSGTGLDMALPLRDSSGNASGETMGIRLVAALGLTDSSQLLSQLRALPPADIIRTAFRNQAVPDGPVIDGHILPQAPHTVFASGQQAPVPLIVGSNARELSTLGFLAGEPPTNATSWSDRIRQEYGGVAPILIAAYGELAGRDAARGYEQVATDQIFKAPALLMARGQVRAGQPAWLYQFAAVPSGPGGKALGAFHGAELPILFGKPWPGHTPFNQDEEKLHEAMMDYWVAFATRGDPNGEGRPDWPALGMGEPALLVLDETIRTTTVGDTTALDALMRRVPPS